MRRECLTVFSHGGPGDDALESSYFTARLAMASLVRDAGAFLAKNFRLSAGPARAAFQVFQTG